MHKGTFISALSIPFIENNLTYFIYIGYEVHAAVVMKSCVFLDLTPVVHSVDYRRLYHTK
jgi:hypothetical protein